MSWTSIDLSKVNPSDLNLVADNTYTFQLNPGAHYNERGGINASATIQSDGEFTGKRVMFSYPDPVEFAWAAPAVRRLADVTGTEVEPNEDPVALLNKIAGNSGRFTARIVNKDDKTGTKRSNLQTMSVKPAC